MIRFSPDALLDIERVREFLDVNNAEAAKSALRNCGMTQGVACGAGEESSRGLSQDRAHSPLRSSPRKRGPRLDS